MIVSKKIMVVVESIDVDDSSGSKVNVALIQNLASLGCQLKVYHYSHKEIFLNTIECILIKEQKFSIYYLLSRLQRLFTRITKKNINPFIESLFGFSFTFFNDVYSIKKAVQKENNFNPDFVLTLSYASSFRPHKALLGVPKWHAKWLAYVHDPYPMHSYPRPYDWVEPGHQQKRNFFLKIAAKSFKLVYPSLYLARWMESYYPQAQGKTIIIPHQLGEKTREKINIPKFFNPNEFNILHAGSLMSARNPKGLIKAFQLFLENNPTAKQHSKLLFIGLPSYYDNLIKEKQLGTSQLFLSDGYMPFKQVSYLQSLASVNVILEAKGNFSPFLPGKFPHCIMANKPILLLGPYYSESKRLLGENYLYWSEIDDVNHIYSHLNKLYQDWLNEKDKNKMYYKNLLFYFSLDYLKKTIIDLNK